MTFDSSSSGYAESPIPSTIFGHVIDAIADALVMVTTAGSIRWYDTAFESLLGQSQVNLLGQSFSDVLPLYLEGQPVDLILDLRMEGV